MSIFDKLLFTNRRSEQDENLLRALETAALVPEILPKYIKPLQEKAKRDPDYEYDVWYMEEHARRTSEAAKRRLDYWKSLDTEQLQKEEWERCREDTKHYVRQWAWTEDPRPSSLLTKIPFEPFEWQDEAFDWFENLIFIERQNGGVLKSRAVGASWIITTLGGKHWQFSDPSNAPRFLYLSRKHDDADTLNNTKSLLEKIRFNIRLQPSFLLPKGFNHKKHLGSTIINPHSGAVIGSDAFTPNAGRGDRATAAFMDEAAAGDYAKQAGCWSSLSGGTADTTFMISTPQGKRNQFYENYGKIPFLEVHWSKHPLLHPPDRPDLQGIWHKRQQAKMNSPALFAQEVEMRFDTSQAGAVYPQFKEESHVITWKEFAAKFPEAYDKDSGRYRIPPTWLLGRGFDVGMTAQHPGVVLWVAVAPETSEMPGTVFIYREMVINEAVEAARIARMIRELEAPDNETPRIMQSVISHEQLALRTTFNIDHHLHFAKANTSYEAGIAQVRDYLAPVGDQPHPFRPELPEGGAPRLFLIVANGQGELWRDGQDRLQVKAAVDSKGLKRLRYEFPIYHFPDTEDGKAVSAQRPFKDQDDAMDALRYLANSFFPAIARESADNKIMRDLPEQFRPENLAGLDEESLFLRLVKRDEVISDLKKKHLGKPGRFVEAMKRIGR